MADRSRIRRGRAVLYHPTAAEAASNPGDWPGIITDVNVGGTVDLLVDAPNSPTLTDTIGAALGAFTDPPSAAEMATLRTRVNEVLVALTNTRTAVTNTRKSAVTRGRLGGQYELAPIEN